MRHEYSDIRGGHAHKKVSQLSDSRGNAVKIVAWEISN